MKKTTAQKVDAWKTTNPLLTAMFAEVKDLSKKKPDAPLSVEQVRMINRLLEACQNVLSSQASLDFLDVLDEDEIPKMSYATMLLSQYVAAMQAFHDSYHGWDGTKHTWKTE